MSSSHSVVGSSHDVPTHPELDGQRVFISGISDPTGEHIARGFARQHTRLVLHSLQAAPAAAGLADTLKSQSSSMRLFAAETGADQAACERLARAALGAFGGLDLIVNLISPGKSESSGDPRRIEDAVADALRPALVLSRAAADHARNSGLAATIVHVCLARSGKGAGFANFALLKSGLEAMTQDQARRWFSHDICVYAFIPGLDGDPYEEAPDAHNVVPAGARFETALTALALNAAGGRSRWLNGVTVSVPT